MESKFKTDVNQSLITGRNGVYPIIELCITRGGHGVVFIDGIGKRGSIINGGLIITEECFGEMIAAQSKTS